MSDEIKSFVITDDKREFTQTIDGNVYTIKIPLPYQKAMMISQTAKVLGGVDAKAFPEDEREYVRMLVTLNNVITKAPDGWKGADQCADEELLLKLWSFYLDSEKQFDESLKKNNNKKNLGTTGK